RPRPPSRTRPSRKAIPSPRARNWSRSASTATSSPISRMTGQAGRTASTTLCARPPIWISGDISRARRLQSPPRPLICEVRPRNRRRSLSNDEQRRRDPVRAFFGGSPGGVIVRLFIMSLLVGFVMTWLGLSPLDLFTSLEAALRDAWANSAATLRPILTYVLPGAAGVIPICPIPPLLPVG